jgi:TFIIF-interacting CTD phosphatase-like protein
MSSDNDKPVIILDLDQTLISAEELGRKGVKKYQKKYPDKMKKFKHIQMEKDFLVFERPYLQDFLSYIFDNFRVSIWTAASQLYATFIIENLILKDHPERKIDWIFFSYHCNISKEYNNGSKVIKTISEVFNIPGYDNADKCVIFDDYHEVKESQPDNCILAEPFEFRDKDSESDVFLQKVTKELQDMVERSDKNFKVVIEKLG